MPAGPPSSRWWTSLRAAGVTVLRRADHPMLEAFEGALVGVQAMTSAITGWENHWLFRNLVAQDPEAISARSRAVLAMAERMTPEDYRMRLLQREELRARHAALAPLVDALIAPASPGPAPLWAGDVPGKPLVAAPDRRCGVQHAELGHRRAGGDDPADHRRRHAHGHPGHGAGEHGCAGHRHRALDAGERCRRLSHDAAQRRAGARAAAPRSVRARGFVLPHHGAMAAALPDLHAAYEAMYRALTRR